ncbi:MAG: nucleotide-binding protein [Thermosipho sp. (in: Bacteria)]|nr:nucleotide-binding protein [Thermosipho sp. (in: thermotogales)]
MIGRRIANYEHTIIVGSSSPNTADRYVVKGVIKEAKNMNIRHPVINILRPSDNLYPFNELVKKYPKIFGAYLTTQPWWDGAHLIAIREADAVLTIGGRKGTYLAGLSSIIAKKRLVPIGSFGGSSEKILQILERMTSEIEQKNKIRRLNSPWNNQIIDISFELLGITEVPRVLIIHGRSNDWQNLKNYLENILNLRKVIIMEEEFVGVGKTLPEKFEYLASKVDCVIAVTTPDDIGALKSKQDFKLRARQNVWLEVGWFWGRLGRERVMILCKENVEIPSDIQGIELYFYRKKPEEKAKEIRLFIDKIKNGVV